MTSKPLDRIEKLIPSLPEKDVPLAFMFLESRNFESLQELINSAIFKIKKSRRENKHKYDSIVIDNLEDLKLEVDFYATQLDEKIPDIEDESFGDSINEFEEFI